MPVFDKELGYCFDKYCFDTLFIYSYISGRYIYFYTRFILHKLSIKVLVFENETWFVVFIGLNLPLL